MKLLLTVATVATLTTVVSGQTYGRGACPSYQTPTTFNREMLETLKATGGLVPFLAAPALAETGHKCQLLKLLDNDQFVYIYRDSYNQEQTVEGAYELVETDYRQPGYIRLVTGQLGLLGSDITGNVRLYPVFMKDGTYVLVACTSFGLFHAEYAYTFMPVNKRSYIDQALLKRGLIQQKVPLANEMSPRDQTCFTTDSELLTRYASLWPPEGVNEVALGQDERAEGDVVAPIVPAGSVSSLLNQLEQRAAAGIPQRSASLLYPRDVNLY